MSSRLRLPTWLLAGVLMVTATACSQPAMTRADARTFARKALIHIGFTNVQVSRDVSLASYRSPDARFQKQKPVQVWRTRTTVPQGSVELYVPRKGNSAVFVRDEASAGGPLLTEFARSLTRARVQQYQRYFSDAERVLIMLHNDPDPDAMASGLALRNILRRTRRLYVEAPLPAMLGTNARAVLHASIVDLAEPVV